MTLTFACVGGAKCGTTTLHEWLRRSPQLALPKDKESPIFHREALSDDDRELFLSHAFSHASGDVLLGKVTPHYLAYDGTIERLRRHNPAMRVIILVRNPIARAASHHKMMVRRGLESRSFGEAVSAQLATESGYASGRRPGLEARDAYLAWSRWESLISPYREAFPSVTIIPLRKLETSPQEALDVVCQAIGIERFTPDSLGTAFNVESQRGRRMEQSLRALARSRARVVWDHAPPKAKRRFSYWLETRGRSSIVQTSSPNAVADLPESLRREVDEFFSSDVAYLAKLGIGPTDLET